MNIMKTNVLSLDNKIAKEQKANLSATGVLPAAQPKLGINALMFQGMQNLMANPKLAQGIGVMNDDTEPVKEDAAKSYVAPFSSNIAFQGGVKTKAAVKTLGAAALIATAGLSATSCKEKDEVKIPDINVVQDVDITIDLSQVTALLAQMQLTLVDFMYQASKGDEKLLAQLQDMQNQLAIYAEQQKNDNATIKLLLNALGDKIFALHSDVVKGFDENNAYQQVIVALLEKQMTRDEAIALFNKLYFEVESGNKTVATALAEIMAKIDLVNENLEKINSTIQVASQRASEERALLSQQANVIIKQGWASLQQGQALIAQNNALIQQNNVIIYNQQVIANKIDNAALSVNATIRDVANYLGMKVDDLAAVVVRTGKSLEEVMKMSKTEIVAAINANTAELKTTNIKLEQINTNVQNVDYSVQTNTGVVVQAASDILDVLKEISGKIDVLSAQLGEAYNSFKGKLDVLTNYAASIDWNTQEANAQISKLNTQIFALRGDVNNIKLTAIEIKNNIEAGVEIDYDKLKGMFDVLDIHQQASKDEIVAKLNQFIAGQEKIEVAINKLGDETGSKLTYIANLLKNVSPDNTEVIQAINNLANSNETNIAAATEKLAAKLDVLIQKADAILNKLGNLSVNLKQYSDEINNNLNTNGEKILAQLKANGAKIDITNMSLAELKAEVEKIKPELQKLNTAATTANTYLDIIAKRQQECNELIAQLKAIGGNGITAEELEAMWKTHDANAYAKFTAYMNNIHADNMDKADEIIDYLKKGNAKAADIYNLLLTFSNKVGDDTEALKKLLQAVYDYLPELICKCNCQGHCDQNDNVNEGIIDIIS